MNIKELAERAGLVRFKFGEQGGYTTIEAVPDLNNLERFAELVAAAASAKEREACAKLVEEVGKQTAAAIRARENNNG